MSQTPIVGNKVINNDSGILTGTYAYSPNSLPPLELKVQNNSADVIQKMLSSSIQRAKQKINMLEGRQREQKGEGRKQRSNSKEANTQSGNNALATAMKVLQSRVYELEKLVEGLEREKSIILKELDNTTSEKKILFSNLEQANRKVTQLEQNLKTNKAEIKELNRKLEDAIAKSTQFEGKCEGLQMTVRHLQNDKQQMSMSMSRRDQQQSSVRQSPSHKQLMMKSAELDEKVKALIEKQRKLQDKQKKLGLMEGQLKERESKLIIEGYKLKGLIDENTQLKSELQKATRQLTQSKDKQETQKESYETYLIKINDMQSEIEMLRQTTKRLEVEEDKQQSDGLDMMRDQLRELEEKYQEVLHLYRRAEEKSRRDQKEIKTVRQRVRQLEDLLSQIVQKVGKLPTCTKDLKYLCVKSAKLMAASVERAITLKTPTKSRSNSINRSLSRSNSQRKNTQHSQLDNYENSNRSNKGQSGSKQKKNDSGSNSKRKSISKSKRIVLSQTGLEAAEKQLTQLKKQYKRLIQQMNMTQSEEIRNRCNQIAFLISDKSEQITKLRQNKIK